MNAYDLDLYGTQNPDGSAVEYIGSAAVKQAVYLWMTSKRGEFVRNPSAGGLFDSVLFKPMTRTNIETLEFTIKNNFTNYFTPAVTLQALQVIPDYVTRTTQINISYYDTVNYAVETVTIYTNSDYATKNYEYETITYIEQNLYNFCMLMKTDMPNDKLIFNNDTNQWNYGKYIFINLEITDPYFDAILQICNGS